MKMTPIALGAAALALATPVMADASASLLFSQSAGTAVTSGVHGRSGALDMRTAHRNVMAFEERPGTRTGFMPEATFSGLWGGTFRGDPPNAILTGIDPEGRNHRVVVRVLGVRRTDDGVRYRVRALRGVLPARLAPANLMIDSVPITAISAAMRAYLMGNAAKVQPWEPIINALYFPMAATVMAPPQITIVPGNPYTVGGQGLQVVRAGQVTFEPGAQMVFTSTGALNITFATPNGQCTLPPGLGLSVQMVSPAGVPTDYPGTTYPGTRLEAIPQSASVCFITYDGGPLPMRSSQGPWQMGMTLTNGSDQPAVLTQAQFSAD